MVRNNIIFLYLVCLKLLGLGMNLCMLWCLVKKVMIVVDFVKVFFGVESVGILEVGLMVLYFFDRCCFCFKLIKLYLKGKFSFFSVYVMWIEWVFGYL